MAEVNQKAYPHTKKPRRSKRKPDGQGIGVGVYEKAVKLLSLRMHTTGELYRKLKEKGFADGEIRPVLKKLEDLNFLDDKRFAEIFVDNLKRYKDFGYFGIKAKLMQRQIPNDIAQQALQDFFNPDEEIVVARRFLGKLERLGRKTYEQLARSLQSKGFRSEVIRRILRISGS